MATKQNEKERIFIGVAWPYANGEQHIGHVAGVYLPCDIFARYHRLIGNDVLMVSGSDTHGTPVTVQADKDGVAPLEVVERYHRGFVETYQKLGLTFDLFTHTDTETHWAVARAMFQRHKDAGFIYHEVQKQLFDAKSKKFLPDRYVEGTCPACGYSEARGDQCDNCGRTYDAVDLKNPRSKMTGSTDLEARDTEHFFLDLGKLNEPLLEWIKQDKEHWRPNVINFTRAELEKRELRGRPITRDIEWGITVPEPGYESKCLYVWYEAVMGYLSAAQEWAKLSGEPDQWKNYWEASGAGAKSKSYYFLGKDNIYFHSIMWPAMLIANGGLNLPYDVPANEYFNLAGRKFSKSRGNAITVRYALDKYQTDAWRYTLAAMAPESTDADFTWDDFLMRVNNELVANWGNLANRVLGFAYKRFEGKVPTPGPLDDIDRALLDEVRRGFESVGELYHGVKLKAAVEEVRRISQKVNQYLNDKAPWTAFKTSPEAAATSMWVALQVVDWLKVLWSPILPETCQKLHGFLGYDGPLFGRQWTETVKDARGEHLVLRYDHSGATGQWLPSDLKPGQALRAPEPLFIKLDDNVPATESGEDVAVTAD